jgi:fatty-acyl-CoA synthase
VAVKEENASVTKEEVIEHLKGTLAKWQLPDDVIFVDQLPHTATGKILKMKLRTEYKDYKLPTA